MHCSNIEIAKTWKQPKCPSTEEWKKKMWHTYTHTHTHTHTHTQWNINHKKKEIIPSAATWKEIIMLSEVSQTEKDKYI